VYRIKKLEKSPRPYKTVLEPLMIKSNSVIKQLPTAIKCVVEYPLEAK
jgi:hypothetical protein